MKVEKKFDVRLRRKLNAKKLMDETIDSESLLKRNEMMAPLFEEMKKWIKYNNNTRKRLWSTDKGPYQARVDAT